MNQINSDDFELMVDLRPNSEVWRAWYIKDRVVYFALIGGRRTSLELAVNLVCTTVNEWPVERPFRVVYDVSQVILTPYARKAAADVYTCINEDFTNSRTAVLLPSTATGRVFRNIAERFLRVRNPDMQRRFFTRKRDAIRWVAADLPPEPVSPTPTADSGA